MLEHPIAGVLVYIRELETLVVGGVLDYWQSQELVEVVVVVEVEMVVAAVDAAPPWKTRTRTTTTTPSTLSLVALDPTQNVSTSDTPQNLEPGGFTTWITHVVTRSRTIGSRTGNC